MYFDDGLCRTVLYNTALFIIRFCITNTLSFVEFSVSNNLHTCVLLSSHVEPEY
jgi:hypothetical protein